VITTAVTEKGRVKITVSGTGDLITVTRQHPSGRIMAVRGMNLQPLSGGLFIGWDYEAPIGVQVTYLAALYAAADTVNPLALSNAATLTYTTGYSWLKDPFEPVRNMAVTIGDMTQYTYDSRTGVHQVMGRPAPITVGEVRSSAADTVTILTSTQEDRDRFHYITSSGHPLLLQSTQQSGIGNMYLAVLRVTETRLVKTGSRTERSWALDYQEVDMPVGDAGAFVTYQDLLNQYNTYQDALNVFDTYFALFESLDSSTPAPIITWRGS
jgi:hypothetical protein